VRSSKGQSRWRLTTTGEGRTRLARRVVIGMAGLGLAGAAFAAMPASADTFRVGGAVTSPAQYVGDSTGTTFTVKVSNPTASLSVGAVTVTAPSGWHIVSCPAGPLGWSRTLVGGVCRFISAPGSTGDLRPHATTSSFRVKATTRSAASDLVGRWTVRAYRASALTGDTALASPGASSMLTRAYSLQVRRVLVASAPATGATCPASVTTAQAGTRKAIVVCAINRSTSALTPVFDHSRLGGTFASGGSFRSNPSAAGPARPFLATWREALIGAPGTDRTVSIRLGTHDGRQSSPTTTFHGFTSSPPPTTSSPSPSPAVGNRAPTAANDAAAVSSNATVNIPVLANDSDPDGDALHVADADTTGTVGSIEVNADGTITYDARGRFSLAPGASSTDTFRYRAADASAQSAPAVVTVTVSTPAGPVNNPPVVTADTGNAAYTENAAPTVVSPGLTVSDPDSPNLQSATVAIGSGFVANKDVLAFANTPAITGAYSAGTGVLTLSGMAPVSDYEAALRTVTFAAGGDNPGTTTRTIAFRVSDGSASSASVSRDVAVTPVNDAPVVSMTATPLSYTEGDGAKPIDNALVVTDPDSVDISGATVAITGAFAGAQDTLGFVSTTHILGGYNPATGVLTLTGSDTVAAYQAALRSVAFANGSDTPSTTARTISVHVTDDAAAVSNTATRGITVTAVNDAPVATDQSGLTTNEDTARSVTLAGTDVEGDALTFSHDATSAQGGTLSGAGSTLTYTPAANYCGTDSFGFTANDGHGGTDAGTIGLSVTCVNDAPVVSTTATTLSYSEGDGAKTLDNGLTVVDPDSAISGATVSITSNFSSADGDALGATPTATISRSYNAATGVLTLTGSDTVAAYQAVLRTVTYANSSDTPSTATRTVSVQVTDAASAVSNVATRNITVAAVNDAPVATDQSVSTDEDTPLLVTLSGTDAESDPLTFTHDATSVHGGTISDSPLTYTPAADYCGPDSFGFTADDGNGGTDDGTISLTVNCVNDAPVVSMTGSALSYGENDAAKAVDNAATVTDVDSTNLTSATATVTIGFVPSEDSLAFSDTANISSSYDALTGVLTLTGNDTVAAYQAALRSITYANSSNNPSTTTRTVSMQVADDAAAASNTPTRDITIGATNDAPTATDQTVSTNEDTGLPLTLSGTDPEGDTLTITNDSASAQGGVVSGSGGAVTYAPPANYCGPDSFGFLVDDGNGGTDGGTVSITVNCVNDAPKLDLNGAGAGTGSTASFSELVSHTGGAAALAPSGTVSDIDSAKLASLTVTLANHPDGSGEFLTANTTGTSITADTYDPTTGVLLLHGTDTVAHYQQVLRTVAYENDSAPPATADRIVNFTANDGSLDSDAASATVTVVALNAAPVVDLNGGGSGVNTAASFTEDAGAVTLAPSATVSDADDADLVSATVTLTNHPDGSAESLAADVGGTSITADPYDVGTGVLALHGTDTKAHYQTVLQSIVYGNASDTPDTTSRSVTFVVNDGQDSSAVRTAAVSVTAANDAPILDTQVATASYTEDQPPTTLAPNTVVSDADNTNLQSATVTLTNHPDGAAEVLSVDTTGTSITAVAYDSTTGVLSLTGDDTVASYQQVLRTVAYANSSQNANSTARNVTFVASDGTASSNTPTVTVAITVVNDPPVIDMNGAGGGIDSGPVAFTEDSSPNVVGSGPVNLGSSATVSDVDNAQLSSATLTLTNHPDGVNESLSVTIPGGSPITTGGYNASTGVLQLTGPATSAQFQAVLQSAKYNNVSNTPNAANRDITSVVNDGSANSTVAHTTVTVTPTNDAPVAGDETFNATQSAIGNTTLNVNDTAQHGLSAPDGRPATPDPTDTSPVADRPHKEITGDILSNDTDPESPSSSLTVVPGTFATNDGGTVTIQADGDFNFEPSPSTSCTDTSDFFDYSVQDGGSPNGTDTGRVTVAITGCVWYVNNNDAQGNSGTSEKPFDTTAQAQTASGNNQTTFVYDGDDTTTGYNTGYTMNTGESLISEGATLQIGSDVLHTADAANKASLTNNNADVVTLAGGGTVKSFNMDPQGTGGGVFGTGLGSTTVTLDDLNIVDNGTKGTQPGLELDTNTGTTTNVSNLTVNNGDGSSATAGDEGVRLNATGTVNFASTGVISVTTNGAKGLDASAGAGTTSLGNASTFDDITVTNSGSGGVLLQGTTGSGTQLGDGIGTDLDLTTVSGAMPALSIQTSGTVNVPASGIAALHATGGPGADIVSPGSPGSTFSFDDVDSTNSANDGINLDTLGTATFSSASGDIGGEAGIGFDLNGGSGAITDPAVFANGSGPLVAEVTGRTGGVVSLAGNMFDTNDAGGGINEAGNTGGSTVYSGATKQFDTGAADALTVANPDGSTHTAVWPGGGTVIHTTSGNGVNVTGVGPAADGNIQFSGSGNTIDSTGLGASNRALNISDVNLQPAGVTFERISSSGGANGIRLNNTGSAGAFTVTGTSVAPSGGTIANSAGPGISLTTVGGGANFDGINVTGGTDDGVNADTVTNLNLTDSTLTNNGDSHAGGTEDRALDALNVTGASNTILRTTMSGANDSDAHIRNTTSGSATWTVSQSTFSDSKFNAGLRFRGEGSSSVTANVTGSTFSRNADPGFSVQTDALNTAHQTVLFDNNNVSGGSTTNPVSGRPEISINTDGGSVGKVTISNNHIKSAAGAEIIVNTLASQTVAGSLDAKVIGNTINDAQPGTLDSLADSGSAIWGWAHGDGAMRMEVTNNLVQNWGNRALELSDNDGAGTADYTVTGNTFNTPDTGANQFEGMYAFAGGVAGDSTNVCIDMKNNDFDGIGQNGVSDLALDRFTNGGGTSQLRFAGNNSTTTAALQSYLRSVNPLSPNLTVETFSNGPTATAATTCTLTSGTP
jgi:hypothetical protein